MTRDDWQRLKTIFHDALDQPIEARRAWLASACAGNESLLREAEQLLQSHDTLGEFLANPAVIDPAELTVEPLEPPEPPEPSDPLAKWQRGTRIGSYEIVEEIARGGMGVVYLAQDTRLGRPVALKSLDDDFRNHAELRERLRREARAAATIRHPSVATIYALEEIDGHLLLISEYVRGPTLRSLIERGPIDPAHVLMIATDVAKALDAAHRAGVIHRDLKPENVIVSADGGAKVVDFGIARLVGAPGLTLAGATLGTPLYMAPEQLLGTDVDVRTDIFAFGIVLIEMITGRHPVTAWTPLADRRTDPNPEIASLLTIANRCAQADPAERYSSADDLLRDLETAPVASAFRRKTQNTAKWWWQFHQGAAALAYIAMLVPLWRARGVIGGAAGRVVFIAAVAAVIVTALLRLHLWFTSRFYPSELEWVRVRAGRWVYAGDWLFVLSLAAGAVLVGERSALDVVLISMAIGVSVAFLIIEPVAERAAFGSEKFEGRSAK